MPSPAEQVESVFNRAVSYAESAKTAAATYLTALQNAIYTPPTLSFTWSSLAAPTLSALPTVPTMPTISFTAPGSTPSQLALSEPGISIDDFVEAAPTLTMPTAPTVSYDVAPTVPDVGVVTVPLAPSIAAVTAPTMLTLNTITTPTIDLHDSWLAGLGTLPTLTLLEPTPYTYSRGSEYASTLLSTVKAKLLERLSGGSGLTPAVEQAIWDRARDRETRTAQGNVDQVLRSADTFGFQLPVGTVAAQLREAEQNYYDKLSEFSRDVSIKQADLEQANLKDTIDIGMKLESQLVDYSYKMEQLSFESAKQYAENALAVHNASVDKFKALLQGYQTYADTYKTIIEGQKAKVDIFRAQLEGEQTKANINTALVQQYKAQIEAGMALVEIYKAQVGGAQTLIQLEQTKINAAGERIRAYVAAVNAETAKVEAYKAGVQAEATKVTVYEAKVRAFAAKVGAQAERARAETSRYSALYQAKASEWEGYKAQVGAESERIKALGIQSSTQLDAFKASVSAITAQAETQSTVWRASMSQYEASQNISIQTAKINNDAIIMTNNARLDAAKTGAQIYAQLAASSYSMIHGSAGVQGSSQMGVSYSYSNDTSSTVSPIASI